MSSQPFHMRKRPRPNADVRRLELADRPSAHQVILRCPQCEYRVTMDGLTTTEERRQVCPCCSRP